MASNSSFLIIGAGNFGAATALSLVQHASPSKVTLLDSTPFPNPRAASHDINKIIRDDYPDPTYMKIMVESMGRWRSSPLYSPFYHETGVLRADPSDFSARTLQSYKALGVNTDADWISVEEARKRWEGVFASADFEGLEKVFWNPRGGWAEAEKALVAVIKSAIDLGAEYQANAATKLLFDADGKCIGAQLQDGREIRADSTILAAGAATSLLLYQTSPSNKSLHAGNRSVATGAVSFFARWDDERRKKFKDVPVFKNCLSGTKGESMSLTSDGIIKFNCDMSFTNLKPQSPENITMSVPPAEPSKFTWTDDFPEFLKERALKTMRGLYGKEADGVKIEGYRMCWDSSTPTHDFLITPHPHGKNLFVATGGSFHGWKFLPVIGDYIVKMLKGTLEKDLADKWAWNKDPSLRNQMANPTYTISGDLSELVGK